jgi:phosphate-selective porin O/P
MSLRVLCRGLLAVAVLAVTTGAAFAQAPTAWAPFYAEVPKDGRIYVFAVGARYDTFEKSGGTEVGQAITRPGYGPNGETVVFDSESAINLYNFKHDKPGEYFAPPKVTPPSPYPSGKFSGLMFGDYYAYDKWHQNSISATNTNNVQGQQGFWFRRIYFTYDLTLSEKFTTRFRLEANSNGQFTNPGNINPYVKDAYLKWTFWNKQVLTLGIQPSLTFDWFENWYGLRHIEKTPADLYRIDSSRDLGVSVGGPINAVKNLAYGVQYGNESGTGSETDKYKIWRLEGRYVADIGIAAEAFYSFGKRPNGQDRTTAQGIVGWRGKQFRLAAQYLYQKRERANAAGVDQTIDIWSGFGYWEFKPKKGDLFFRYDDVKGELGSVTTGLPGGDGIDYVILSTRQPFKAYIFGGEWWLFPTVRVSPNVELFQYDNDPDPTNFPGRDKDQIYRITFFWSW